MSEKVGAIKSARDERSDRGDEGGGQYRVAGEIRHAGKTGRTKQSRTLIETRIQNSRLSTRGHLNTSTGVAQKGHI